MRRSTLFCSAALLFIAACGGSDSSSVTGTNGNTNGGTGTSGLTATIDGKSWAGLSASVVYKNSIVSFAGTELSSGITLSVATSTTVNATGTYSLANAATGGLALITQGAASWSSATQGGAGTLVITTLTANHIVATFSFDAPALTGAATGTRHVTNGKIDATF